jgi:hypothetical protein
MIRDILCDSVKDFKLTNGHTYKDLMDITKLNKTQLTNIIKNNGAEVRLETIENAVYMCGMSISVEVKL